MNLSPGTPELEQQNRQTNRYAADLETVADSAAERLVSTHTDRHVTCMRSIAETEKRVYPNKKMCLP